MASIAGNRIVLSTAKKTLFNTLKGKLSSAVSYNQGDLLCLKAGLVQIPTSESDNANFLGIADETVVNGILKGPYSGLATTGNEPIGGEVVGPFYGVVAQLKLNSGDGLAVMGKIYGKPSVDAQTVSSAGTNLIGVYTGVAAITGDGIKTVDVLLGCNYPSGTLAF